jgi:thiol-disulfide isomerase/thioredoxin
MKIFNFLCFISSITFFLNSDINDNSKLTPVSLKNLITENGAKNNIIYTYTDWCAPCIKEFPDVLKFCEKNNCKLYIIILSKDGNANLNKYQEKLLKKI